MNIMQYLINYGFSAKQIDVLKRGKKLNTVHGNYELKGTILYLNGTIKNHKEIYTTQ